MEAVPFKLHLRFLATTEFDRILLLATWPIKESYLTTIVSIHQSVQAKVPGPDIRQWEV